MSLINIVIYTTKTGKVPFLDWQNKLDRKTRAIIKTRLDRVAFGNFGDSKPIKNGNRIRELRIDYGPGYRVYFATKNMQVVVLLIGGDKGSQDRDIAKAKQYWLECEEL
jgi:putative addiction module killer protein